MNPQLVILRKLEGTARLVLRVIRILDEKLDKNDNILCIHGFKYIVHVLYRLASAEDIVEVSEHSCRTLSALQSINSRFDILCSHSSFKLRKYRFVSIAPHSIDKALTLRSLWLIMQMMEQTVPCLLLLEAGSDIASARLKE